jgi:hypothetical protein
MYYYAIVQPIIAGFFLLAAASAALRKQPEILLALGIASMGFGNFWVFALGTIWLPVKIVGLWTLFYVVTASDAWAKNFKGTKRGIFMFLLLWIAIVFALAYALPVPDAVANSEGTQGVSFRPLSQLMTYSAALSFVPLAFAASRKQGALIRIMNIYAIIVIVNCVVGLFQYILLKLGMEFMPIYRASGGYTEFAAFSTGDTFVTRLYALAGEPKQLGMFLTPFVIMGITLSFEKRDYLPVWWNRRYIFAFAALIDIMTYSTAVLLALGLAAIFAVSWSLNGTIRMLAVVLTLTLLVGSLAISPEKERSLSPDDGGGIVEMLYSRSIGRIEDEASERYESKALRLITVEHPENLLTGFGLGMYVYLVEGVFFGTGVEGIDSGWVTLLMDLGAVGLLLVLAAASMAAVSALKAAQLARPRESLILRGLAGALAGSCALHLGTNALVAMMIWLGVTLAANGFLHGAVAQRPITLVNARRRPNGGAPGRRFTMPGKSGDY